MKKFLSSSYFALLLMLNTTGLYIKRLSVLFALQLKQNNFWNIYLISIPGLVEVKVKCSDLARENFLLDFWPGTKDMDKMAGL